jgi:hypothetical protein
MVIAGEEGETKVIKPEDGERSNKVAPASYIAEEAVDQLQASEKLIAGIYEQASALAERQLYAFACVKQSLTRAGRTN